MFTEMSRVVEQGNVRDLVELLRRGADPNCGDPESPDWVILMSAIAELDAGGSIDAVAILLRYGASPNSSSSHPGTTPLLVAVAHKQIEAARLLLSAGADLSVSTDEGDSALRHSVELHDYALAKVLLLAGADKLVDSDSGGPSGMNALGRAAWGLDVPMVQLLLEHGASPCAEDVDRRTPMERMPPRTAANADAWDTIKGLLQNA